VGVGSTYFWSNFIVCRLWSASIQRSQKVAMSLAFSAHASEINNCQS